MSARMRMRAMVAAAAGALGLAIPVTANAAPTPPAAPTTLPAMNNLPSSFTFVPPAVGPISVDLGATIINGQQIAPPVHVLSGGVAPAPITWTIPSDWSTSSDRSQPSRQTKPTEH